MRTCFHDLDFLRRQAVEGIDVAIDLLLQLARVRAGVALLRREDAVNKLDERRLFLAGCGRNGNLAHIKCFESHVAPSDFGRDLIEKKPNG